MSAEAPNQPATEDVSFADILDEPEVPEPPPAADGKAGSAPENGDVTPGAAADGCGEPAGPGASPEPMSVSVDGPPGAGGDEGGGAGSVAPPPGVVTPAAAAAAADPPAVSTPPAAPEAPSAAPDAVPDLQEAPKAEPVSEEATAANPASNETPTENPVSDSKPKQAADSPSESMSEEPAGHAPESKPEKGADPASDSTPEKAADSAPKAGEPVAKPETAPVSKTTPTSEAAVNASKKPSASASEARPIPADAEPIRAFSGGAAVAGLKSKATPKEPEPEPMTELEKLWKPVKQNPADFTAWTLLIQYVEAQCFMEDIRGVLKAFLARYPYCYGYWKKYSDLEKKRGTPELCNQVFEGALAAVPLSVDLWLHYLGHMRAVHEQQPERVRTAFERAIATCGKEFRSDRLWEQYASWETANKEPVRALAVYKRAIAVPTLSYRTHFENLEQFVGETPPQELLTVEQFLEARRAVLVELRASEPPAAAAPPASDLLPPGCDEPPPGVPAQPTGLSADEECVKLRAKILAPLRQLHKDTEKQVSLRWNFEEGIKRPYFHVKPLEKTQLKNWKAYLDFEIEQGDKERIRVLFERCMIACALYEEYWLKYIRYLESQEGCDPDQVRGVFRRACHTHLPNKAAIHLTWATFEERQGDRDAAAEVMERLSSQVTLLEVTQRRINLARRAGRLDAAEEMYAEALKNTQHRPAAVIIAIKFIRFLYKVRDNRPKALDVLREALQHDTTNRRLYMQMVDIGFQSRPVDVALVQEALQMALAAPFDTKDKLTFAHRRLEFLEEFTDDIESLQAAQEEYVSLARAAKADAKKKKQEEEPAKTAGGKRVAGSAVNGTEKKARVEAAGSHITTITETPARPNKTAAYRAPVQPAAAAPAAQFTQPPPVAAPGYPGYGPPPRGPPQQQQYQYPGGGYQQQGAPGWGGYPPQYNYNQYGQGYQYPYQ